MNKRNQLPLIKKKSLHDNVSVVIRLSIVFTILFSHTTLSMTSFERGNEFYRQGKYTIAIAAYKQSINEDANATLAYFNMANCWYQLGDLCKAAACYQTSIAEAPDFFSGYLNLGILLHALEEWPSTITIMEEARAMEPDNKQVLLILAVAYKNMEAYPEAVRCLQETLGVDSTMYDCYFLLYDIYQTLSDWDEACYYLNRYPDTEKRADEKYRLLGNLAEINNEWELAIRYNQRQIALSPNNKWAHYKLVETTANAKRTLLALERAREALKRFPDFGELALLGGNIAFESKQWKDAEYFYSSASRNGEARGLVGLQNVKKVTIHQNKGGNF